MKENNGQSKILKLKAEEDLNAAKQLVNLSHFSTEIVLFHCQQAIEKALKAFLDTKSVTFPKTHDLELLLSLCIEKDSSFEQIKEITTFTPYAIEIRYDEFIDISKEEAAGYVNQAEKAVKFILAKVI